MVRCGHVIAGNSSSTSGELFGSVHREQTLSDQVARSITEAVISGRFAAGERLPSERELAERFGVSRTVIREAIRSLVAHGLVESRSGSGVRVATAGPDAVNRSMSLFLRGNSGIDYAKVHEVRSALEIEMAGSAAQHATEDDLGQLRDLLQRMPGAHDEPEQAAQLDIDFHRAIAAATHNGLFVVMLGSIDDVLLEVRRSAFEVPGMLDYATKAHGEILQCLERRDGDGARREMLAHLQHSEEAWSDAADPVA